MSFLKASPSVVNADSKLLVIIKVNDSPVPRRFLQPRCPNEVWDGSMRGKYCSVTSPHESRIQAQTSRKYMGTRLAAKWHNINRHQVLLFVEVVKVEGPDRRLVQLKLLIFVHFTLFYFQALSWHLLFQVMTLNQTR